MHTYAYDVVGVRYDTLIGLVHRKNSCGVPAAGGELKNTSYPGASTRVINEPCTFSVQGSLNDVCIFSINIISYSS